MPKLCEAIDCCGCSSCVAACARSAIIMTADREGFLHPSVDGEKCTGCGRCERACPVLHRPEPRRPLAVYAARAKDAGLRKVSSSGGLFSLLARQTLLSEGVVFGAAVREDDLAVCHRAVTDEVGLAGLRGSKYVQSDMGTVFAEVRKRLEAGQQVLFSGTPCQVAGCRRYLGRDYENLLCVDVVCHAVPSPLAWRRYLDARLADYGGRRRTRIGASGVSFRRKDFGWKRFALALRYADAAEYLKTLDVDTYLQGFLCELYNRPSCHDCRFRELRSGADLTLADYWNVRERFPDMDDDLGTSLVLVNTGKGAQAYAGIREGVEERLSDFEDAVRSNAAIMRGKLPHPKRGLFFRLARRHWVDFDIIMAWLMEPKIADFMRKACRRTLWRLVALFGMKKSAYRSRRCVSAS